MSFAVAGLLDMSRPERKRNAYSALAGQAMSLFEGERDRVANLAQISALVAQCVPSINWVGFYLAQGNELVLGPFQGKVACVRIPFGRGVCGTCAATRQVQVVKDVEAFPGHIACDSASRSELVLPIIVRGALRAVLDLDSPETGRFDETDAEGFARIVDILVESTDW